MRDSIDWDRRDWAFVGGVLLGAILLFTLLPQDALFYRGDMLYYAGMEQAIRTALNQGEFLLWNLIYSEPMVANPESMLLYPPYLLLRLIPVPAFFVVSAIFHLWLLALALYLLLRHFDLSRLASLAGAAAVAFSTQFMFRVVAGHYTPLPVFGWSVLTLLFFARLLHFHRYRDLALCIASCLMLVLAGHTQFSLTGLGLAGSYFIFYLIQVKDLKQIGTALIYILLLGLFNAGLLAAVLLPILEYAGFSVRAEGFSYAASMTAFALNAFTLWNLLIPFVPFEAVGDTVTVSETLYYSSMILPGLAWLALRAGPVKQRPLARYALVLGGFAVLLAMGSFGPFGRLTYALVPFFRSPGRFLLLWILTASLLIGMGVQVLQQGEGQRGRLVETLGRGLVFTPLVVLILWAALRLRGGSMAELSPLALWPTLIVFLLWALLLAFQKRLPWQQWLACLVALILLDSAGHGIVSTLWPRQIYVSVRQSEQLFACFTSQAELDPRQLRVRPDPNVDLSPMPRAAAANGIPAFEVSSGSLTNLRDLLIAGRTGMRIAAVNAFAPPIEPLDTDIVLIDSCEEPLYFDPLAAPRVNVVNELIPVADTREASLEAVLDPDFDYLTQAVISVPEGAALPTLANTGTAFEASAEIIEFTPNRLTIRVQSSAPGLLVLAESYYPGWQAHIDGESTPIWRANHALRGVFVPAGSSDVVMSYRSRPFERGLWISGGSLIALLALGLIWPRVQRRAPA